MGLHKHHHAKVRERGFSDDLIAKLATEDATRSVFRLGASPVNANTQPLPSLIIDYTPVVLDPVLNLDTVNGDPDLNFASVIGSAPFSATRTVRDWPSIPTRSTTST